VARLGFEAMMRGDEFDSASGWRRKLQSALANMLPVVPVERPHRRAEVPRSARR